jgi:mono/diheme cytochrome c family protein
LRPHILLLLILSLSFFANSGNNINTEHNKTLSQAQEESFLSLLEYGKMLYNNPRGISCTKCHGKTGKGGEKIAKYYDKHKNVKLLKSINVTNYSLKDLTASLNNQYRENGRRKRHKIMPMYYLTTDEVLAIFTYLQDQNKKK